MLLSARDIDERNEAKKSIKKELYTKVLTQMCRKIELHYSLGKTECVLHIPEFIFGYPSFNLGYMTLYIYRQLQRLGYRTSIFGMGFLHVAWGPLPKKKKITIQTTTAAMEATMNEEQQLPSLANLKKAADTLRKKYAPVTKK